jgi:hypothetical protein
MSLITKFSGVWLFCLFVAGCAPVRAADDSAEAGRLDRLTNGPAVFQLLTIKSTNAPPANGITPTTSLVTTSTIAAFERFLPDSLNHLVWTNLIAHTNGRSTSVWAQRTHPPNWPTNPPVVKWNPASLIYGWRGWTAISPCWEGEGNSGQVPITALTRRHGYTRGHGMGPDGFNTNYIGRKVWFVTAQNELVSVKIVRQVVRIGASAQGHRDYTIFLFDRDLPASIEPMSVAQFTNVWAKYSQPPGAPIPFFRTEQHGSVSAEIPGFTVPTWKGGDSGSPDMLPLPGELVFYGGRSTTGPTPEMQADMDELCRLQKLDPKRYQMRWADLSKFPDYTVRR